MFGDCDSEKTSISSIMGHKRYPPRPDTSLGRGVYVLYSAGTSSALPQCTTTYLVLLAGPARAPALLAKAAAKVLK